MVRTDSGSERPDLDEARTGELQSAIAEARPALLKRARLLAKDEAEASDLVQDACEHALRTAHRFTASTPLSSWLSMILRNLYVDRVRSQRRRASFAVEVAAIMATEEPPPDAAEAVDEAQLRSAIEALRPELREVFQLHAYERLSYPAIANRLGIPTSSVGTRLLRARRRIRELLAEQKDRTNVG